MKATEGDGKKDRREIAAHYHLHYILKKTVKDEVETSESKSCQFVKVKDKGCESLGV